MEREQARTMKRMQYTTREGADLSRATALLAMIKVCSCGRLRCGRRVLRTGGIFGRTFSHLAHTPHSHRCIAEVLPMVHLMAAVWALRWWPHLEPVQRLHPYNVGSAPQIRSAVHSRRQRSASGDSLLLTIVRMLLRCHASLLRLHI